MFDALIEERSVTRAARRIGLSQPAMSNALARLRDSVGDPLFERAGRGIEPTSRALAMAEPVRAAMGNLQRALGVVQSAPAAAPALRIAANTYARWLLIPAVAADLRSAPAPVRLDLRRPDPEFSSEAVLTIDWRAEAERPTGIQSAVIVRDSLACIVRRANRSVGDRYSLQSFLSSEHVAVREWNGETDVVDARLATLGERRRVAVTVADVASAAWLVARTDLVAVVPRRFAEVLAPTLGLGILTTPLDLADVVLEVSWPGPSNDDPAAMWVKQRLTEAGRRFAEGQRA